MRTLLLVLTALATTLSPASGELLEEIIAVVGKAPILNSDLELAAHVHLVPFVPGETEASRHSRLLDARVRLELQFRDLEASGTLYRLQLDVTSALAELQQRAGGDEQLRACLFETGLTWADVEELALRVAATNAYVDERLRPRISVSLEELETAYQRLVTDDLSATGDPIPQLNEVRDQLHRLLVERKLNDEIELWLDHARDRLEVTRFQE